MSGTRKAPALVLLACALLGATAAEAAAKGLISGAPVRAGVALDGSRYRYVAIWPRHGGGSTLVARIVRGPGLVSRSWRLPGAYYVTAPAYDLVGGGLSAEENALVLTRFRQERRGTPQRTKLAILDPGAPREEPISRLELRGEYGVYAVSPDGETVFLTQLIKPPPGDPRFFLRAIDTSSGRLLPRFAIPGNGEILSGLPIAREPDSRGHRVYTLYSEPGGRISVLALDTVAPKLRRFELPSLRGRHNPMLLSLALDSSGQRLTVLSRSSNGWDDSETPVATVDVRDFAAAEPDRPWWMSSARHRGPRPDFRAFKAPRRPGNLLVRRDVIGESTGARSISMHQFGDPRLGRLLVFGCIHGDECAAEAIRPLSYGCPDPRSNIFVVPNLDPDGTALGTRLNGRGVDLNRNFPAGWRAGGEPGDLEYAGPRPFSEPESRLAAWLVRGLRPRATVWFHQFAGTHPFVRAWGQSVPSARRLAALAGISFRVMPWQAGTAPNWQNHRFPGTASFVVELPEGPLAQKLEDRLGRALVKLGREVGQV